ncbi:MAG: twin transmembrane helix small protein [Proteobacteria bacterium]|nr:twin transmembrane helix small protein [Pseudomonadota bacterium]
MFASNILPIILIVCMFVALLVVIIGVIAMAKNGNFNKKYSNKLMRMRVLFQGVAVLIFAAIIYLSR